MRIYAVESTVRLGALFFEFLYEGRPVEGGDTQKSVRKRTRDRFIALALNLL